MRIQPTTTPSPVTPASKTEKSSAASPTHSSSNSVKINSPTASWENSRRDTRSTKTQSSPHEVYTTPINPGAIEENKNKSTNPNMLYGLQYTLPKTGNGLSQLTFPMQIDQAMQYKQKGDAGNYYAMQFDVKTKDGTRVGTGYIGMQPREDGKAAVAFSGFGPHFSSSTGRSGADGGEGASNSNKIDFQFGHKYNLTIECHSTDGQGTLLKGYVQDVTDPLQPGPRLDAGELHVDTDVLLGANDAGGFIELYNKPISNSSEIGPTRGVFFAPFGVADNGKDVRGSLTPGEPRGRYHQSTTGTKTVVNYNYQPTKVIVSIRGAGSTT